MRNFRKSIKAVSPIVATLMLVLVSVGTAGAFYLWQTGWQGDIQDNAAHSGTVKPSLTIGGSSTVYDFTAVAVEYFEAVNPDYRISYQSGGSGAGVAAVGTGAIDIGSCSRPVKQREYDAYPDLDQDGEKDFGKALVQTIVGYDLVAVCVGSSSHGLLDINQSTLYDLYATNGGLSGHTSTLDTDTSGSVEWDELPIQPNSATMCTGTGAINLYDRAEHGGTEETFCDKVLGIDESTLEAHGINVNHETGNQNLIAAIVADADGLGFCALGQAIAVGADMVDFEGVTADPANKDSYAGTRPLCYVTIGEPKGDIKLYIDFCLSPDMNQKINHEADYISLYD
jgi:phosphate transport system substrate-binding protein